jgi:phosphatidyl-myo-inositol dimannoside synthase
LVIRNIGTKIFECTLFDLGPWNGVNQYFHRFSKTDRWASKIVLRNASTIIANSRATKGLIEKQGYPSQRIQIANPGADPEMFRLDAQCSEINRKYKPEGIKILLSISRLVEKMNHVNVLKALPEVVKLFPKIVYLIVGEGPQETTIRRTVDELELQRYVKLLGYIEPKAIAPYYHVCDVFVMPSKTVDIDYESFGIVYVEANACGKPVIAGKSGGIEDAVIDGVTGLLVDPENIDEISKTIIRLFSDECLSRRLGENGLRRVEKKLNWTAVGNKLSDIIVQTVRHEKS